MHGQAVQPPSTVALVKFGASWRINKAAARVETYREHFLMCVPRFEFRELNGHGFNIVRFVGVLMSGLVESYQ